MIGVAAGRRTRGRGAGKAVNRSVTVTTAAVDAIILDLR